MVCRCNGQLLFDRAVCGVIVFVPGDEIIERGRPIAPQARYSRLALCLKAASVRDARQLRLSSG